MPKTKTIAALRQELAAKENKLAKLSEQRKALAAQLAAVDKTIASLEGSDAGTAAAPKKAKKAKKAKGVAKVKKAKKKGGRRRRTLPQVIEQVLASSPKGMRAKDVANGVRKAGYKSKSKDFYNTVSATLGADKRFQRVTRGVYKLA